MRQFIVRSLANCLVLLMPVLGALFGYVVAAFLRLTRRARFHLVNGGSVLLAPAPMMTGGEFQIGPAGFVLVRGILSGSLIMGIVVSLTSMLFLTFINIRISQYIRE